MNLAGSAIAGTLWLLLLGVLLFGFIFFFSIGIAATPALYVGRRVVAMRRSGSNGGGLIFVKSPSPPKPAQDAGPPKPPFRVPGPEFQIG